MFSAKLELNLGEKAREYAKVMDKKITYKRSKVQIRQKGDLILISILAQDPISLVASISSVLKQVRIIGNTQLLFDEK